MQDFVVMTQHADVSTGEVKPKFIVGISVQANSPEEAADTRFRMLGLGESRNNCTALLVIKRAASGDVANDHAWIFPVVRKQPFPSADAYCFMGAQA